MVDYGDKLACFQAVTGLDDTDLCTEILAAHGWDLELAISAFTGGGASNSSEPITNPNFSPSSSPDNNNVDTLISDILQGIPETEAVAQPLTGGGAPGVAWKIITLPISIISGSLGLISGAIGIGFWVAGGVISHSMNLLRWRNNGEASSSTHLVSVSPAATEALDFIANFERDFGNIRPNFVAQGFMDALQRSRHEYKLLFVYLHSPDHPDTPFFCETSLCSEMLSAFINANFVSWGGSIRASEGFKMSNSLKASRFPFCAVVMAATNQRIALLQQVEGSRTPEEMLTILQRVTEESEPVLVTARLDAEERRNNIRLREEQDAAYRAALEADQARERQRQEEQERLEREAAEAQSKLKEEEEARERAAQEAAEKEAALARRRQEKAMSLGTEPEKGPTVTQMLASLTFQHPEYPKCYSFPTYNELREDMKTGVYVENLTEFEVNKVNDILCLLTRGAANRKVAATNMNRESSRSHSVFTCVIESRWEKDSTTNLRFARLNLVDLAGSERKITSGAEGERLKEAASINKSLSTLGHVIMVLVDVAQGKQRHIPYRYSRLTFLLQDSLGGNSKTMIIANVSPSICSAAETLSTLKFAQRAKLTQNNVMVTFSYWVFLGGLATCCRHV